jgi:hypothetical protein
MLRWLLVVALFVAFGSAGPVWAQAPAPAPEKKEEKPKTIWEETTLFSYIENSYVGNLTGAGGPSPSVGRGAVNEGRFYDLDEGYTFNIAEFSIKKDPSERYPFGYGLVVTAGLDSQKNHSLGIFRDRDDAFSFRNTKKFDFQEMYLSATAPLGSGLTVKGGKFVTLLGYEVIESPNNLNFSRGYLFTLAIPLTHTGGLLSYTFTDWFSVTAGVVRGWDNSKENNDRPSYTGQFALTPVKDLTANLNWISGPEQNDNNTRPRYVLDWVFNYTGFKNWTLGLNVDYGHETKEASLEATKEDPEERGSRKNTNATWWGWAAYAAYDWTDKLRTSLRQERFQDTDGARSGFGSMLRLYSTTATVQYKIWKGLVGRVEYRHDDADEKVFKFRGMRDIGSPTSKTLDTISVSLYYSFF